MSKIDVEKQVKIPGGAKGDLIVRDASKLDNLGVGANNTILQADSAQTLGVKWSTPAAAHIANTPAGNIAATDVQAAINELDTEKAASSHAHSAADITSGTLPIARGGTGQVTQTAAMDGLSPTTTKGDLLVDNGVNVVRLAVGADGEVLKANSGEATGVEWATGDLADPGGNGLVARTGVGTTAARTIVDAGSSRVTVTNGDGVSGNPTLDVAEANLDHANIGGTVPIANGGTGQTAKTAAFDALAPTTTKGDVIAHNGTDNVRIGVGADGQALVASAASAAGVAWQTISGAVPSGVQGQKLSWGAGNVLAARDWMVLAEDYGAVGDGSTDDTAAILAAVAAVLGTGKTLWLSKTYKITSSIAVAGGNFTLDGGGTLAAAFAAASSEDIIRVSAGGTGVTTGFNETLAKAVAPYTILTDLDVDDATGLAVGDYVQLLFNDSTDVFSQVSIIRDITANTLTFDDPVLIPVDATHASSVLEQAMRDSIHIRNLTFTGTNVSGSATAARAIRATSLVNSSIENCVFKDWTISAAVNCDLGYNVRFDGLYLENSGGNESDLQLQNFSNSFIDNIVSVNASGFGPQLIRWTNCKIGKINSTGAQSRAFKMQGCTWNHGDSITASKSQTGTGFSVTNACYSNTIEKVIAHDNADQGIWFSGERNLYNRIAYAQARGNDTDSSNVDISFSSGDESNHIFQADCGAIQVIENGANSITRVQGLMTQSSAATTVTNTVSETLAKFSRFPANSLKAGTFLTFRFAGQYSTNGSTDQATIRFRLSSSTIHSFTTPTGATATNEPFTIEMNVLIVSIGGSGVMDSFGVGFTRNGATVNTMPRMTPGTTIDTTASRDFEWTFQWNNMSVNNTISVETYILERKN